MPELPEVLHFKHYIESTSLNQTIAGTEILNSQVVPNTPSVILTSIWNAKSLSQPRIMGNTFFSTLPVTAT